MMNRKNKNREIKDKLVGVLCYDMKGSGGWHHKLSRTEETSVHAYCRAFFMLIATKHHLPLEPEYVNIRNNNTMAYFDSIDDCVSCGLELLNTIPEMIRMCPHLSDIEELTPRIIAFSDIVTGENMGICSGEHLHTITKSQNIRRYFEGGCFRIIGEHSFGRLASEIKREFGLIDGTRRARYQVFESIRKYDTVAISEHHVIKFPCIRGT
jgi:hypothetical protein